MAEREPTTVLARPGPSLAWRGNLLRPRAQSPELSASGSLPLRWRSGEGWWQGKPGPGLSRAAVCAASDSAPCSGLSSKAISPPAAACVVRSQPAVLIVQLTLRNSRWRAALAQVNLAGALTGQRRPPGSSLRMRARARHRQASCVPASQRTGSAKQVCWSDAKGQVLRLAQPPALPIGWRSSFRRRLAGWRVGPGRRPTPIGGR